MSPRVYFYVFKTSFGRFRLGATSKGLYSLDFPKKPAPSRQTDRMPDRINRLARRAASQILRYLQGEKVDFRRLPIDWTGTRGFSRRVLQVLRRISWGRIESYQSLARCVSLPRATRAVGRVLHLNRLPIILPCHRVLLKTGGLGGFSKGKEWKKRLLKIERNRVDKLCNTVRS